MFLPSSFGHILQGNRQAVSSGDQTEHGFHRFITKNRVSKRGALKYSVYYKSGHYETQGRWVECWDSRAYHRELFKSHILEVRIALAAEIRQRVSNKNR